MSANRLPSPSREEMLRQCLQSGAEMQGVFECHPDDQRTLAAFQYLKSNGPFNLAVWAQLRDAAQRGDLFIVTREAGNSEERLARLQKTRRKL